MTAEINSSPSESSGVPLEVSPKLSPAAPLSRRDIFSFQRTYNRIKVATCTTNEEQVARELGVSREAIDENRRAHTVPRSWLETLLIRYRSMPMWMLFGQEPRFLKDGAVLDADLVDQLLTKALAALARAPHAAAVLKVWRG